MITRRRHIIRPNPLGSAYPAAVLGTSGLKAYWRMQETSGTVAADATGTYDGTIIGGPTMGVAGPLSGGSNAMKDFLSTKNIQMPSGLATATQDPVTIEFWYKLLTGSPSNSAFSLGNPGNTDKPRIQAHVPYSGTIYWDDGDFSGSGRISVAYPSGSMDNWAHLAFVGDTVNSKLLIYCNGSQIAVSVGTWIPMIGSVTGGCIGYWNGGGATSAAMAEFAVYNTAVSAADIAAHYAAR